MEQMKEEAKRRMCSDGVRTKIDELTVTGAKISDLEKTDYN